MPPPKPPPARLSRDREAEIRRAAIVLLANLLAPGAAPTQRMLAAGWPDAGARMLQVAGDVYECHGVRSAALAFAAAAAAVDPLALDADVAGAEASVGAGAAAGGGAADGDAAAGAAGAEDDEEAHRRRAAAAPGALRALHRLGLASLLRQQALWEALRPLLAAAASGAAPPAAAVAACALASQALGADPSGVGARLLAGGASWEGAQPLFTRSLAGALPQAAAPAPFSAAADGGADALAPDLPTALLALVAAGAAAQRGPAGLPPSAAAHVRALEWLAGVGWVAVLWGQGWLLGEGAAGALQLHTAESSRVSCIWQASLRCCPAFCCQRICRASPSDDVAPSTGASCPWLPAPTVRAEAPAPAAATAAARWQAQAAAAAAGAARTLPLACAAAAGLRAGAPPPPAWGEDGGPSQAEVSAARASAALAARRLPAALADLLCAVAGALPPLEPPEPASEVGDGLPAAGEPEEGGAEGAPRGWPSLQLAACQLAAARAAAAVLAGALARSGPEQRLAAARALAPRPGTACAVASDSAGRVLAAAAAVLGHPLCGEACGEQVAAAVGCLLADEACARVLLGDGCVGATAEADAPADAGAARGSGANANMGRVAAPSSPPGESNRPAFTPPDPLALGPRPRAALRGR
jgi:hypothetical protein